MSKVKMVKFHTNVQIDGKYESYVTAPEYLSAVGIGARATITETEQGITLETEKNLIKVGWTNIVYMQLEKVSKSPAATTSGKTK